MTKAYRRAASSVKKVTISLPSELLDAVDRVGKARGRSRSAVFQEALRGWLADLTQATLAKEYEAGYRSKPEERSEIAAAEAAAVRLLSEEKW